MSQKTTLSVTATPGRTQSFSAKATQAPVPVYEADVAIRLTVTHDIAIRLTATADVSIEG